MAIVKKYPAKVVKVVKQTEGVYTLEFESLQGKFKFEPGQFLHIAIDREYDGTGQWPDSRCFSMQSSPDSELLKITYAVKGVYTAAMQDAIQPGIELWLKLPYGDLFEQEHDKQHTVFISGGTGITPFLSLFTHNSFKEYTSPVLYAGFRDQSQFFYQQEIDKSLSINPSFNVISVYQDVNGILDIKSIYDTYGTKSCYFISGPPVMIKNFKNFLISKGVPAHQVLTDDWE